MHPISLYSAILSQVHLGHIYLYMYFNFFFKIKLVFVMPPFENNFFPTNLIACISPKSSLFIPQLFYIKIPPLIPKKIGVIVQKVGKIPQSPAQNKQVGLGTLLLYEMVWYAQIGRRSVLLYFCIFFLILFQFCLVTVR